MLKKTYLNKKYLLASLCVLLFQMNSSLTASGQRSPNPAESLVDLAARILNCSAHPCLGESEEQVRETLRGAIVSDETFYFSDIAVAYPSVKGTLAGLVEWDVEERLSMIGFKLTGFHVAPAVLIAEIEQAVAGCQLERDDDFDVNVVGEIRDASVSEWFCLQESDSEEDVLIELFIAPGLLLFEMSL